MLKQVFCLMCCSLVWASSAFAQGGDNIAAVTTSAFVLGPGDMLQIAVWRDEDLTREVLVRPDGKVSFPLINEVQAAGRTVEELREDVEKRIAEWVPDSPVSVVLTSLGSPQVFVVGKVARPGAYLMSGRMSVIQVLALAGGMTTFSDDDDILIVRPGENGETLFRFDYSKLEKGKKLEQNIQLLPGDTIIVP